MKKERIIPASTLVKIAVLTAIAFLISIFEFSMPFAPSFYKLDISSAVALVGGYTIGPMAAIIIGVIKTILKMICFGSTSAFVGEYVDIIITILYVFPASIIYRNHKNNKTAILGMVVGVFFMTLIGCILNYFLLIPIYAKLIGIPMQSVINMASSSNGLVTDLKTLVIFVTLPFNILKGTICSIIGYLSLIPISKIQRKNRK